MLSKCHYILNKKILKQLFIEGCFVWGAHNFISLWVPKVYNLTLLSDLSMLPEYLTPPVYLCDLYCVLVFELILGKAGFISSSPCTPASLTAFSFFPILLTNCTILLILPLWLIFISVFSNQLVFISVFSNQLSPTAFPSWWDSYIDEKYAPFKCQVTWWFAYRLNKRSEEEF